MIHKLRAGLCLTFVLALLCSGFLHEAQCLSFTASGEAFSQNLYNTLAEAYLYVKDDLTISYLATPSITAAMTSLSRGYSTFVSTPATSQGSSDGLYRLPLMAAAMGLGYNSSLFSNHSATNTLILDSAAMAAMWTGDLVDWNDIRIAALNPWLGLPAEQLALVYCDDLLGEGDVLARYLSNISSTLAAQLSAPGNFSNLAPVLSGRAVAACTPADKAMALARPDMAASLVPMMLPDLTAAALGSARMRNAAGVAVAPSTASVTQALTLSEASLDLTNLGGTAWPLSTMVFAVVQTQLSSSDCSLVKELMSFVSWMQINDQAANAITASGHTPLDRIHRQNMLDTLTNVTCNGKKSLTTAFLSGMGPLIPNYESWATDYETSSFKLKYYTSSSLDAIEAMIEGSVDFGSSGSVLPAEQQALMPDMKLIPVVAYGYVFAYNIPSLRETEALVIDFQTASDIYLNKIKTWDHRNITALNPGLTLPSAPIVVVYNSAPQVMTGIVTNAIGQAVPEFAEEVGTANLVTFPVVEQDPNRTLGLPSLSDYPVVMRDNDYTFTTWVSFLALTTANVRVAKTINKAGNTIEVSTTTLRAAIEYLEHPLDMYTLHAPGELSWPMINYNAFMVRTTTMTDCNKAAALVDWIYWTQTAESASDIADSNRIIVASGSPVLMSYMLDTVSSVECQGAFVSKLAGCVTGGAVCSDMGVCNDNACTCKAGREGTYCESVVSDSSVLVPVLASVLPAAAGLLLLILIVGAIVFVFARRRGEADDWEIDYEELQLGDLLGEGGYGQVYKGTWKGTDVAVKMMTAAESVAKNARESFVVEARTMAHLRHPNVVLFMGASTKPPNMCIVMEFMALGSLFDLLHNDLIPDIPMALKVKIAYQAAKGMHFLHSSGIVHRDLKSLNLLLDNKWNVKVSDFGLTRFKNTIDQRQGRDVEGSVPWMAPELLAELNDVDYSVADVYSYGVILWEVLTRLQPYHGMLPAQIAVGVIRNDIRPSLRADVIQNPATAPFVALMTKCWHRDTTMRPTFVEIMKQLQAMIEDVSGSLLTSTSGGSSSSASTHSAGSNSRRNMTGSSYDSDATDSSNKGGTDSEARASSNDSHSSPRLKYGVTVPRRDVTFVVCDLARCNESWQTNPVGAAKAITRFGQLVRDLSAPAEQTERVNAAAGGYIFSRPGLHSGGTYMLAFPEAARAAAFALHLQREVADRDWPRGVQIYARVALHFAAGVSGAPRDDVTRTGYEPENYDEACKLNLRCRPGAVVCSSAFSTRLGSHPSAADFKLVPRAEDAYQLVSHDDAVDQVERKKGAGDGDGDGDGDDDEEDEKWAEEQWDQGMGLCSSNCCAWIINTSKISMGAKIGEGNFGRVVAGAYFGTKVAVKQLYKTKLDDLALTKMRKEAAILSGLDHPNIVKLIGLCVSSNGDGGPMLVMELVPRGNLRALLADGSVRLGWKQKLAMLRDAALGLAYLHSRGIVHRDIKSSNLLVEKNLTVKVGDFGFATAKQDNGTQTRCGTPCWTAPEIISGTTAKYSEKADVYSFAIVMWEVLTRKAPYQDKNMMTVALNVINGDRPPVPADCPKAFGDIMQRAWKAKPDRRPTMDDLLMYFNSELGTDRV